MLFFAVRLLMLLQEKWKEESHAAKRDGMESQRPKIPFREKDFLNEKLDSVSTLGDASFNGKNLDLNVRGGAPSVGLVNNSLNMNQGVGSIANNTKLTRQM